MKSFILFFISIILFSCSIPSLETDPILVNTINDGEVLKSGDFFNISFNKSSDSVVVNPTTADVTISYINWGEDEDVVEPVEFTIDFSNYDDPKYKITPDFAEGLYTLLVKVYEDESIVSEHRSEFIVYSGNLSGDVSIIHPSKDLYTNSVVILESKLNYDANIDPYLVWKTDGQVIIEGYKSQGFDRLIWDIEDRFGFIDVTLELFPFKLTNTTIPSSSNVNFSFVANPIYKTLYSNEILKNYNMLYFFNGNYIDEINKDRPFKINDIRLPSYYNGFYGMNMDSKKGFEVEDSFIPVDSEGNLENFSLILDILPISNNNGNIIYSSLGENDFSLSSRDGEIVSSFFSGGNLISSLYLAPLDIDQKLHLVASFIKNVDGYKVLFYVNGLSVGNYSWIIDNVDFNIIDNKVTYIGGLSNIPGSDFIIDTLKIYNRDNNGLNNIYPDNLKDRNESGIIYNISEGYNSVYKPINLVGEAEIDGENIGLSVGSELNFANTINLSKDYTLKIKTSLLSKYQITLFPKEGDDILLDITGSSMIKRVNNQILLNDKPINDNITLTGFNIKSIKDTLIDSITLYTLDRNN